MAVLAAAQQAEPPSQPAHPSEPATSGAQPDGHAPRGGTEAVHPGGPADTHAEAAAKHGEAHEQHPMPNEIWWKWANFAILAGVLGWLISKYAGAFFQSRTDEIQRGIAEATKARTEAEARAAEIERRVNNLSAEVDALRRSSTAEIAREGERVRAQTEASLKKIQAQAEAEIASAAKHASHDLKAHTAKLALQLAEQQVRAGATGDLQERLAADFVEELRTKAVSQ
jgi:F-type H+-transporting ATPase subunit b